MRVVKTPDEYDPLYKAITDTKDAPSNPQVLQRVELAVHQQVPTMTPDQVDRYYMNGDLNKKDWSAAKDKLLARIDHLRAEGRAQASEARAIAALGRTIANSEQAQAEQMLRAIVGKGPNDSYDDQDGQLYAMALQELTRRSNAFPENGGTEKPLVVARELEQRIAPIRRERLRLKAQEVGRMLALPAQTSAEATARLNTVRGTWPKERIAEEERKILDMFRSEQAQEDLKMRTGGGGQSGGSGSTNPLRKAGTKTTTSKAED
jgi:uncharacterized small protein (DUF1192 family)